MFPASHKSPIAGSWREIARPVARLEIHRFQMNIKLLVIVLLATIAVVVLASLGLTFLPLNKPVVIFGLNIAEGDGRFIPPVAGGLAFVVGIIFLLLKSKRAG